MKPYIYIAARYQRRLEMLPVKQHLQSLSYVVTSRWIDGLHEGGVPEHMCAHDDIQDVEKADVLLTYSEKPDAGYTSGGRHVEFGLALALKKKIIVIGKPENVFHHAAGIIVVSSLAEAINYL